MSTTTYQTTIIGAIPTDGARLETQHRFVRRGRCLTLRGAERLVRRGSHADLVAAQPGFVAHRVERCTIN